MESIFMRKEIKKFIIIILCMIIYIAYLQWGRDMEICNTVSESFENGYCEDITIIANKLFIKDKEQFAESVIQKCIDNTWKEIRFSYDLAGYPQELSINVYMNNYAYKYSKRLGFRITYSQKNMLDDNFNIKDNPEKFSIKIE